MSHILIFISSSLHEKKKDYIVRDNQIFRPISNGTSSGASGKPPISGAGMRETPKPLPRTIQTTPIDKPSESTAKPLEIAIHSGNRL